MFTRTNLSRRRAAATVILCAAALSGCAPAPDGNTAGQNLDRFYDQELAFGDCTGFAADGVDAALLAAPMECSFLSVPLDYSRPDGDTLRLAVSRIPATGGERVGSLILNPGGPGGSGVVQSGAAAAGGWKSTEIPAAFDIVGFDPRGVGASEPAVSCFSDAERDAGADATTLLGTSGQWYPEDTEALVRRCAEGSGGAEVLAAVGTRNTARDLDVLRAVLGDERLSFAGQSYGTRLGTVYAEMFPNRIRAMVLDGPVDPSAGTADRRIEVHEGFQRSFNLLADFCSREPDCPLGTDPGQATRIFNNLVRPLLENPVPAGDGRELTFDRAAGGVASGLYDAAVWPVVIAGIRELAEEGRGDVLLEIGDVFGGRSPDGVWNNQVEAGYAVNCNDEQRRTPEQEAQLRAQIDRASPFMASGQDHDGVSRDGCEAWPVQPSLGYPYGQDVEQTADVLVVAATEDPATPFEGGEALAETLGATLLKVNGAVHTIAQAGTNDCVNDVVAAYLIEAKVPPGNAECTL